MKRSAFVCISIAVLVALVQVNTTHALEGGQDESMPPNSPVPSSDPGVAGNPTQSRDQPSHPGALYVSNFAALAEGDFPPDIEFRGGNMQVDKSRGDAMLQFEGGSWFHIPLDATLPANFVIEFDYYTSESYAVLFVSPFDAAVSGQTPPSYSGYRQGPFHFFSIANTSVGVAVDRALDSLPRANASNSSFTHDVVPIRLEVKGRQARVFVEGDQAVLLPSAEIPRTDVIEFFYGSMGAPGRGYVGNIRVLSY